MWERARQLSKEREREIERSERKRAVTWIFPTVFVEIKPHWLALLDYYYNHKWWGIQKKKKLISYFLAQKNVHEWKSKNIYLMKSSYRIPIFKTNVWFIQVTYRLILSLSFSLFLHIKRGKDNLIDQLGIEFMLVFRSGNQLFWSRTWSFSSQESVQTLNLLLPTRGR